MMKKPLQFDWKFVEQIIGSQQDVMDVACPKIRLKIRNQKHMSKFERPMNVTFFQFYCFIKFNAGYWQKTHTCLTADGWFYDIFCCIFFVFGNILFHTQQYNKN